MDWWDSLTGLQQIFASIAIPATLVMVIQFIMLLFGFSHGNEGDGADAHAELNLHDGASHDICDGHSHDICDGHSHGTFDGHSNETEHHAGDHHDNADALRLFTLRGIIAFLAIGGWTGIASVSWKVPVPVVFLLALGAGWLALYFVAWSIRTALRLQQSGNVELENALGTTGEVYIPIPALKKGLGKVSVIVQDRLCEFSAVTGSERILKTGEKITVMGVESEGVLLVAPKDNPPEGVIIEKEL